MATLKITQTRSQIGQSQRHRGTLRALGLGKIGKSVEKPESLIDINRLPLDKVEELPDGKGVECTRIYYRFWGKLGSSNRDRSGRPGDDHPERKRHAEAAVQQPPTRSGCLGSSGPGRPARFGGHGLEAGC